MDYCIHFLHRCDHVVTTQMCDHRYKTLVTIKYNKPEHTEINPYITMILTGMSVLRPLQTTPIDVLIQNIILKVTMWITEYLGILLVGL